MWRCKDAFDPLRILEDIAGRIATGAAQQGVLFKQTIPARLPSVGGDTIVFERATFNLLNNALPLGRKTLTEVSLSGSITSHERTVIVSDNGKGITAEDLRTTVGVHP